MKPILFKPEFIHPIMEGKKIQTRRIVKKQPQKISGEFFNWEFKKGSSITYRGKPHDIHVKNADKPYNIGEVLWVRESWGVYEGMIFYKADEPNISVEEMKKETGQGWRSPVHLKKEDSRLQIQVTGIFIQMLNDITEHEAKLEGVAPAPVKMEDETVRPSYRQGFFNIWNEIHGEESIKENPFVWVYSFKVKKIKGIENEKIDN